MKRLVGFLLCATLLGLFSAHEARAGWVIEQVVRSGAGAPGAAGDSDRQVITFNSDRMKSVVTGRTGKPVAAWIMDLDAQSITTVQYEQRTVTTGTVQEYAESLQGATAAMGAQMAETMKKMRESLKDMPPEQRQMVEQMMRKSMPPGTGPAPSAEACRQPQVEVRPIGQRATIAGYSAVRYDVFEDGKLAHELWVSPAITAWRELDPKKLERYSQAMLKATASLPGCGRGRAQGSDPRDPAWKLAGEGYPVRTVKHGAGEGATIEVVKAESRAVPAAEFQPPADFTRQTFKQMMGGGK